MITSLSRVRASGILLALALGTSGCQKLVSVTSLAQSNDQTSGGQGIIITSGLAQSQPPVETAGSDRLGMNLNCRYWSMDATALDDCARDLDLIKGLGVGSVRMGIHWYMLTGNDGDGFTIPTWRAKFLSDFLNLARTRGLKILVQIGLEAPVGAYKCGSTVNQPSSPSTRMDFCDDAFSKVFSSFADLVLPFTPHIELFNETNWNYPTNAPTYSSPSAEDYVLSRSKTTFIIAKRILDEKRALGLQSVLHSQGISYFYDKGYPNRGWRPPAELPLITAADFIYSMKNGWQGDANVLTQVLDSVSLHPYFNSEDFPTMLQHITSWTQNLVPGGNKNIWITEFNSGTRVGTESDQVAVLNQMTAMLDSNLAQKAFWYVVRAGNDSSEGDTYGIYTQSRDLARPLVAAAIRAYASRTPESVRFLPETYRTPIVFGAKPSPTPTPTPTPAPTPTSSPTPTSTYSWSAGEFGSCSAQPNWSSNAWSACSVTCGGGTQTRINSCVNTQGTRARSVTCKGSDGKTVADSNCKGAKPATSETCNKDCTGLSQPATTMACNKQACVAPTCSITAQNGTLNGDGSVAQSGRLNWRITNAQSADYRCTQGSYVENKTLANSELISGKSFDQSVSCQVTRILALDGRRLAPPFCGATVVMKKLPPTCSVTATDGQVKANGLVIKQATLTWKISNATTASYRCQLGTYVENGQLTGSQLSTSKAYSQAITCTISKAGQFDGSSTNFSACSATARMIQVP